MEMRPVLFRPVLRSVFLIILLLCGLPLCGAASFSAHAAGAVSFSAGSVSAAPNRLIDVEVRAQSDEKLSAALFRFSYDPTVLEFRAVKPSEGALTEAVEVSDGVNVSYLCRDGADVANTAVIFSLRFKTLREGEVPVSFSVEDCVSASVTQMPVGSCTGGTVTVAYAASANSAAGSRSEQSAAAGQRSSGSSRSSARSATGAYRSKTASEKTGSADEMTDIGVINDVVQQDADRMTPLIVLCASLIAGLAVIGLTAYRVIDSVKNRKDSAKGEKDGGSAPSENRGRD